MKKQQLLLGKVSMAVLGASLTTVASAQDSGADQAETNGFGDIIVTAQRREESLQDVPVSITALSGDDLETFRFRDPADLSTQVPNLSNSSLSGAGTPIFSLRGVSMSDGSFNQSSPVAVYLDEVYKGNVSLLAVPFFDLERVEVLRGPQGTLYGKNTTGGAVNFITRKPVMDTEFYVTVGAGNFGLIEAEAALNVALSDNFAVRVAGTFADADGWLENVTPGVDDANSTDEHAVRLSALWEPRDNLELLLRVSTAKSEPITSATTFGEEIQPTLFGLYSTFNAFGGTSLSDPSQAGLDFFQHSSNGAERRLVKTDSASLTVNWDLSDDFKLTSISSWDEGEAFNPANTVSTPNQAGEFDARVNAEQFTQDLRLTSNLDGPFNFVAGLYYANEELESTTRVGSFFDIDFNLDGAIDGTDCSDPLFIAAGFPASPAGTATEALFNGFGFSLGDFAGTGCNQINSFNQQKKSYAAYFDGSYELSDSLVLRAGIRFTHDDAELTNFNSHFATVDRTPLLGLINGGSLDPLATVPGIDFSDSEVTGRIGLDYTLPSGALLYATYSQGYREGAFNGQAFIDPTELGSVDPEFLDSYEIGFKSTLWDDRIRLNGALFYYDYTNQQFLDVDPQTFAQTLVNIDGSTIKGGELELAAQFTPRLLMQLGVGVLDAEIDSGFLSDLGDLSGLDLPSAPDLSVNLAFDWVVYEGDPGSLNLNVNGTYQDETLYVIGRGTADDYHRVNARLTFVSADESWSASIWGNNLTQEKYASYYFDGRPDIGFEFSFPGAPRTYGIEVTYRY